MGTLIRDNIYSRFSDLEKSVATYVPSLIFAKCPKSNCKHKNGITCACVDSVNCTYVLVTCISSLTFLKQRKKVTKRSNIIFTKLQDASGKKRLSS